MFWGLFFAIAIGSHFIQGGPYWIWSFMATIVVMSISRLALHKPQAKAPSDSPKSEEDVHAEAKRTEDKMRKTFKERKEEYERMTQRPTSGPPPAGTVLLSADSLKVVRNILLKHHEMKRSDADYQTSDMCSHTNSVIQQINGLIDKTTKKAAL